MAMQFDGKVAFITGAARGQGASPFPSTRATR